MADVVDFCKELTSLFNTGWVALANSIPVAWPNKPFTPPTTGAWIEFQCNPGSEDRHTIGGHTNWYKQLGVCVVGIRVPVNEGATQARTLISQIKSIMRDKTTDSTQIVSPIFVDGPIDEKPWLRYNVTFNWVGDLLD